MNKVMEIRGGDISCVYDSKKGIYIVYITRYGECGHHIFPTKSIMEEELMKVYDFDEEMIKEFESIIVNA